MSALVSTIDIGPQLGPVIITTQYPPNKWHSLFDDPTIADAICDRLIPIAIKLNLKGKSLRGKKEKTSEKITVK